MAADNQRANPNPPWLLPVTRGLLVINGLFWLGMMRWIFSGGGIGLDGGTWFQWMAIFGLAIDGILYFWIALGLVRRPRFFTLAGIGLSGFSLLLTVADPFGFWDFVIMALIAAPGLLLLRLWHLFRAPRVR